MQLRNPVGVVTVLTAFSLAWGPAATAAAETERKELLLRRQRRRQEPFMVNFRVSISGGPDNAEIAQKLATQINTAGTDAARIMSLSVARVPSVTFPPVAWPPPPEVAGAGPAGAPAPAPGPAPAPTAAAVAANGALALANRALQLANENQAAYDLLKKKIVDADTAATMAMNLGHAGTPVPVAEPAHEHTFGRLIYDALINTPPPATLVVTTPAPLTPFMYGADTAPPPTVFGR